MRMPESITQAAQGLREGKFTAFDFTRAYLSFIKKFQPELNAFITVTAEQGLEYAERMDGELKRGRRGSARKPRKRTIEQRI